MTASRTTNLLFFVLMSVAPFAKGFAQSAQFKGFAATERILSERLLERGSVIKMKTYLPSGSGSGPNMPIHELLGSYFVPEGERVFRNGRPNGVNMLLWHLAMSSLSKQVGQRCVGDRVLAFNAFFENALAAVCEWPSAAAKSDKALLNYWTSVMGYDAPPEEFEAWKKFFLTSSYANRPARESVAAMTLAILYNPHFLLRK